uniref:Dynein light chain Tctex-type 1 n=1 Tax=Trichobilharzia regenti TaxID=157069 RepID=A0AA85JCN1_TRIRE|nr:unnamed protein product [Trichobilharzia regenti]
MDDFQASEETTFVPEEVKNIVKEVIEAIVGSSSYSQSKVQLWTSTVIEQCLNQLTKLGKPFKYIVTCIIMQKSGAGLHTASSCYWDNTTDVVSNRFSNSSESTIPAFELSLVGLSVVVFLKSTVLIIAYTTLCSFIAPYILGILHEFGMISDYFDLPIISVTRLTTFAVSLSLFSMRSFLVI